MNRCARNLAGGELAKDDRLVMASRNSGHFTELALSTAQLRVVLDLRLQHTADTAPARKEATGR